MSLEVIKKTQVMLGKYVNKPPLTDKLLGKPPFRYLHDILNVVINDHGFLKGLYTDDELKSDHVKDKDAKIAFLQKWIDATSLAVGESLNVRPSKIVAGHEVENTNILLQATARGIEKKIDSSKAVSEVLSQPKTSKKEPKEKNKEKGREKTDSRRDKVSSNKAKTSSTSKSKVPTRVKDPSNEAKGTKIPTRSTKPPKDSSNSINGSKKGGPDVKRDTPKSKDSSRPQDKTKTTREKKESTKARSKPSKGDKDSKDKEATGGKLRTRTKPSESNKSGSKKSTSEASKENSPPKVASGVSGVDIQDTPDVGSATPEEAEKMTIPQADSSLASEVRNETDDIAEPISKISQDLGEANAAVELPVEGLVSEEPTSFLTLGTDSGDTGDREEKMNSLTHNGGSPSPSADTVPPNDDAILMANPTASIDPAISKAMGRNEGQMMEPDHVDDANTHEPSDSGVGSLESPKDSTKTASLPNEADSKDASPVPIPPTPGPRPPPLRAYHPDLPDGEAAADILSNSQSEEPPERPKTGMEIRPRTGRKSARPPSARPAPPKVRERKEIPPEEMPRPPTGKPMTNLILDSDKKGEENDEMEEDENFTVGNKQTILDEESVIEPSTIDPSLEKNKRELLEGDQDAKGVLVAQILETKKELEDNRREAFSPETPGHRRVPIEQAFQGDANRNREKELIQKDVEKLTSSIQALTRSVNPLAKMLDYLQEDFDSMQKELESWRRENKTLEQSLKSEQSSTEQQLEPLKLQLEETNSAILDQRDRISAIKSVILRNEERVNRLIAGINVNS